MSTSRGSLAPKPTRTQEGPHHLAVTFALNGQAAETAAGLITKWLTGELGELGEPVQPLTIISIRLGEDAVPETAQRIADRRRRLHLTQEALAKLAGVTKVSVNRVERGHLSTISRSGIAIRRALAAAEAGR